MPHFLVVDDDPVTCTLIQRCMKGEAKVDVAYDGEAGLRLLEQGDYDAVLVDQMMPGMDGMSFLGKVKARGGEHPPILMMTASSSVNLAVSFMKSGGSDFIEKPLDPEITRLRLFRVSQACRVQREQRERLAHAERERDVLLAAVTHDLRSPLGVISNIVTLMRELEDPDEIRNCLDLLGEASRNMHTLADDFLILSKDRSQSVVARPAEADLSRLLRELKRHLELSLRMRKIDLMLILPQQPCAVETDVDRLRQVLTNLADNALKHSRCQRIEIRLDVGEGEVRISVSDDGLGLPAGLGGKLDSPFKESSGSGGFGLGLAICRRLCFLLRSELVHAQRPGGGTVFSFALPRRWPHD
jgi:signal transduction histidine kinase